MPIFLDNYSYAFHFGIQVERIYSERKFKYPSFQPSVWKNTVQQREHGCQSRRQWWCQKCFLHKKKKKLNKKHAYSPTESLHCPGDEGLLVLWARSRHSNSEGKEKYQYVTHCRGPPCCDIWWCHQSDRLWEHNNKQAITTQDHECYGMEEGSTGYQKATFWPWEVRQVFQNKWYLKWVLEPS